MPEDTPSAAAAIVEIHNLLNLYPHVVDDESQYHRVGEIFSDDAVYEIGGALGVHVGLAAIERYLRDGALRDSDPGHAFCHNTVDIHVHDLTPTTARAMSRCLSVFRDGRSGMGVYQDELVRTPAGWRIHHRPMGPFTGASGH